jgi:uncharacterized DUF497 family protein
MRPILVAFVAGFDGAPFAQIAVLKSAKSRAFFVGQITQALWTAAVTYRHEETIRIISVRRARDSEKAQYLDAQAQRH